MSSSQSRFNAGAHKVELKLLDRALTRLPAPAPWDTLQPTAGKPISKKFKRAQQAKSMRLINEKTFHRVYATAQTIRDDLLAGSKSLPELAATAAALRADIIKHMMVKVKGKPDCLAIWNVSIERTLLLSALVFKDMQDFASSAAMYSALLNGFRFTLHSTMKIIAGAGSGDRTEAESMAVAAMSQVPSAMLSRAQMLLGAYKKERAVAALQSGAIVKPSATDDEQLAVIETERWAALKCVRAQADADAFKRARCTLIEVMNFRKIGAPRPHYTPAERARCELRMRLGAAEEKSCAQCSAKPSESKKLKACAACKQEFYCDASCQKLRWPAHKEHCKFACATAPPKEDNMCILLSAVETRDWALRSLRENGFFMTGATWGSAAVEENAGVFFDSLTDENLHVVGLDF
jgi:hypothetical protein